MPQTTVNIDLRDAGFTGFANQTIKFDLMGTGTDSTSQVTVAQGSTPEEITTDASGIAAATLWDNGNSGTQSIFQATLIPQNRVLGKFIIPIDTVSIDLWDLLQNYAPIGDATEQQPDFLQAAKDYTDAFATDPSSNVSFDTAEWKRDLNLEIGVDVQAWSSDLDAINQELGTNNSVTFEEVETNGFDLGGTFVNEIETTITDNDSALPTSGAVVDKVPEFSLPREAAKSFRSADTSSGLSIADDPSIDIGTGDFSIFFWSKLPSASNTESQNILEKVSGSNGFQVYFQGSSGGPYGTITTYLGGDSFDGFVANDDDCWHFNVLTFDRDSQISYYIDGKLSSTAAISAGTDESTATDLRFLFNGTTRGSSEVQYSHYIGLTKDLLTTSEITKLYNDPRSVFELDNLAACLEVPAQHQFFDRSPNAATVSATGSLAYDGYAEVETIITDSDSALPTSSAVVDYSAANRATNQKIVKQASDLSGTLDSTKVYVIDGIIDMGSQSIEVPAGGLSIIGLTFDVSQLTSSENTYDMFTSPVGGSGNLVMMDVGITTSGTGSSVFALTDATGFNAIEIKVVNFNGCTSLGYLDGYRQGLESGTGRFGGTPELEFRNAWVGGYRTETTIARGMSNFTSLFKAGSGFAYAGRVIIGMNCDLPATGAFCDFTASNIDNDESLQLSDCRVTRAGALNASDTTIYPNIDHTNVKCLWSDNAGLPNTTKYIKSNITTEVATVVSATNTYYPLAGTFTTETSSHLDMPANGEFRLLSGNGTYQLLGDFVIDGSSNDVIDMRVTKSTDGGATWPTEITHIRRQVNSLVGGRDVAFFPINFIATLQEDDRVRLEIENTTSTSNLTAELDSYFIVTAL